MGQPAVIFILIALLLPLWWLLRRDYIAGVAYAVFLCVSMPTGLRILMPGSIPQFTIYRLVLMSVFLSWCFRPAMGQELRKAPLFGAFCFCAITNLISLLLTTGDFVVGLKTYLELVLETALFSLILITSLRGREDAFRVLRAACLGVMLVAAIAFFQKYSGFNPVTLLSTVNNFDDGSYAERRGDTSATYQHRILLGTGMSMGWPLALAFSLPAVTQRLGPRWMPWFAAALMIGACYFANSRGPWLASVLASCVIFWTGGQALRRKMRIFAVMAVLVLVLRPGVFDMFAKAWAVTADAETIKGGNFWYRIELWRVAWSQISTSPERFLFGCGPSVGMSSTLDWNLSYRGGQDYAVWSWDNHLAYDLYQSGVLGLSASLLLYGTVLLAAYRFWRALDAPDRPVAACILASLLCYCFMLTNVMMFAKPVNFLFWTVAAVLFALRSADSHDDSRSLEALGTEDNEEAEGERTLTSLPPRKHTGVVHEPTIAVPAQSLLY